MGSPDRRREVEALLERASAWSSAREDVAALALVGSWARDAARSDSDVDLVVLTHEPASLTEREDWIEGLAPGATLARTADWGAVVERRLLLPSGLEVDVAVGLPSWADAAPVDPGTRRVVEDGLRVLDDPRGLLAALVSACETSSGGHAREP